MTLRKAETRRKIELGGLVIKAGLSQESSTVILGALMEAANTLRGANADAVREKLDSLGRHTFEGNADDHV